MELVNNQSKYLIDEASFNLDDKSYDVVRANYNKDDNRERIYYQSEYYGDHSENWVVCENNKKETMRINTKYIITIKWSSREKKFSD